MIFCPPCSSFPVVVITPTDKRKNSQQRRGLFWSQSQHIVHHGKEIKMPGALKAVGHVTIRTQGGVSRSFYLTPFLRYYSSESQTGNNASHRECDLPYIQPRSIPTGTSKACLLGDPRFCNTDTTHHHYPIQLYGLYIPIKDCKFKEIFF